MDRETAAETLNQVENLRQQTRADLRGAWFPLTFFGIATLLSAIVVAVWGGQGLGVYWFVAGIGGGLATGWYYHRLEDEIGVSDDAVPYVVTAIALFVAAFGLGMVGGIIGNDTIAYAGPPIATAIGYFIFARLEGSRLLTALSVVLLAVGIFFAATGVDSEREAITLIVILGLLTLGTGLTLWRTQGRR